MALLSQLSNPMGHPQSFLEMSPNTTRPSSNLNVDAGQKSILNRTYVNSSIPTYSKQISDEVGNRHASDPRNGEQTLFEICSALGELSCAGRCSAGPQVMSDDFGYTTCGYDDLCWIHGDCCDDITLFCKFLWYKGLVKLSSLPRVDTSCLFNRQLITSCENTSSITTLPTPLSGSTTLPSYSTWSSSPGTSSKGFREPGKPSELADISLGTNNDQDLADRRNQTWQFLGSEQSTFLVVDETRGLVFQHKAILQGARSVEILHPCDHILYLLAASVYREPATVARSL